VGVHGRRRFVASRTTWRGIRFAVDGSPWSYAAATFGWRLLSGATLGLAYPFLAAADARWSLGRRRLGSEPFGFDGSGWTLFPAYLVAGMVPTVAVVGGLLLIVPWSFQLEAILSFVELSAWEQITDLALLLLVAVAIVEFGPASWLSAAAVMRWQARHTTLGGARLAMPRASTLAVLSLFFRNFMLTFFSLGILGPVATGLSARFYAAHLRVDDVPDLSRAGQAAPGAPSGEGLAELFGSADGA
jgi:uncharacterized membrane protein YjgN (DUF898 family)